MLASEIGFVFVMAVKGTFALGLWYLCLTILTALFVLDQFATETSGIFIDINHDGSFITRIGLLM